MHTIPEYTIWTQMKQRCYNSNNNAYKYYGGRGIKVCQRWLDSFETFYTDLGPRPFPKAQIDRKDNNGDYEPDNCRWTTARNNIHNSRVTKLTKEQVHEIRQLFIYKYCTQKELSIAYNISISQIRNILNYHKWKID
jgi:hypothetical protein